MKIIIKETKAQELLSIIDPKTGLDWIQDFLGNNGALTDGQFIRDDEKDAYTCNQENFEWWSKIVSKQEELENRIFELSKVHGAETVKNAIRDAYYVDLEDLADSVNKALDEAFEQNKKGDKRIKTYRLTIECLGAVSGLSATEVVNAIYTHDGKSYRIEPSMIDVENEEGEVIRQEQERCAGVLVWDVFFKDHKGYISKSIYPAYGINEDEAENSYLLECFKDSRWDGSKFSVEEE